MKEEFEKHMQHLVAIKQRQLSSPRKGKSEVRHLHTFRTQIFTTATHTLSSSILHHWIVSLWLKSQELEFLPYAMQQWAESLSRVFLAVSVVLVRVLVTSVLRSR